MKIRYTYHPCACFPGKFPGIGHGKLCGAPGMHCNPGMGKWPIHKPEQ